MDSTTHVVILIDQKSENSSKEKEPCTSERPVKEEANKATKEKEKLSFPKVVRYMRSVKKNDLRKVTHSVKVGIALVLVSLLYLLDPLYEQVGDNAMWAIMTVVVIFEFYAGATLGKGLNRGIGTVLGGGLGCLAASLAQQVGGTGNSIIVGVSVFIFGAGATYSRLVPSIKKRYDYGAMIFILTFNLVAVSGLRADKVLELARQRLSTIGMGFAVCVFVSLFLFPNWASDDLHNSLSSNFHNLANSIQGCMEEYFEVVKEKDKENGQPTINTSGCKLVLNSKAKDENLANFAKWEPWHGKFGLYYPWEKYLQIGELLRELAASTLSLKMCIHSPRQPSHSMRDSMKEACEAAGDWAAERLRELGDSLNKMTKCPQFDQYSSISPRLKDKTMIELEGHVEGIERLAAASFVFSLIEIVEKVQELAKEVQELAHLASFSAN